MSLFEQLRDPAGLLTPKREKGNWTLVKPNRNRNSDNKILRIVVRKPKRRR